jgi:hypothetical protein
LRRLSATAFTAPAPDRNTHPRKHPFKHHYHLRPLTSVDVLRVFAEDDHVNILWLLHGAGNREEKGGGRMNAGHLTRKRVRTSRSQVEEQGEPSTSPWYTRKVHDRAKTHVEVHCKAKREGRVRRVRRRKERERVR